jgi:hypothetical protein
MRNRASVIGLGALTALCSACGSSQLKGEPVSAAGAKAVAITYPASVRGVYFRTEAGAYYCAEPPPDTAVNESLKMALKAALEANQSAVTGAKRARGDSSAEANASASQGGKGNLETSYEHGVINVELAGRSELVLVVRESLYRVCEASQNNAFSPDQVLGLYNRALENIKSVAEAIKAHDEAKKVSAEADRLAAEAKLTEAQAASAVQALTKELDPAMAVLVVKFAKPCVEANTKCINDAKKDDAKLKKCGDELKTCVQEKIKLLQ